MFLGTYEHTLDSKNRLNVPSKFRIKLTESVVLSKGFDGCLELRSSEDFAKYANKLMSYSSNKSTNRLVTRELLANASEINIDSNGRILLPANLINEASIKKEIILIGLGNKIEIWKKDTYYSYKDKADSSYEKLAEEMEDEFEL